MGKNTGKQKGKGDVVNLNGKQYGYNIVQLCCSCSKTDFLNNNVNNPLKNRDAMVKYDNLFFVEPIHADCRLTPVSKDMIHGQVRARFRTNSYRNRWPQLGREGIDTDHMLHTADAVRGTLTEESETLRGFGHRTGGAISACMPRRSTDQILDLNRVWRQLRPRVTGICVLTVWKHIAPAIHGEQFFEGR